MEISRKRWVIGWKNTQPYPQKVEKRLEKTATSPRKMVEKVGKSGNLPRKRWGKRLEKPATSPQKLVEKGRKPYKFSRKKRVMAVKRCRRVLPPPIPWFLSV